jgi:hypothetical protein
VKVIHADLGTLISLAGVEVRMRDKSFDWAETNEPFGTIKTISSISQDMSLLLSMCD